MIEIQELTKDYGQFRALDHLNLSIEKGTVFGFVGPNGAGKSTTFSILATLLIPSEGTAVINGFDVRTEPKNVRGQIGYMPDFFGVYDQFKVHEYLDFYGASYGLTYRERQAIIPQLLELVNLTHKHDDYVDVLSRGMKQRLCLARSLIHDPNVLILDEPASGLDPRARIEMRGILRELKAMDKTILISSHILPELAEMCDSLGVIENGRLIAQGDVKDIERELSGVREFIVKVPVAEIVHAENFFTRHPLVSDVERDSQQSIIQFVFNGDDADQIQLLREAINTINILSFSQKETNLEDIFLAITKGDE
ncbi:MAG: ATP-binding cassette domain-containing protein [Tuberibacillus sp.]